MLNTLFFSIGFLYILSILFYFFNMFKSLTSSFNLSIYKDSWALVTACTDGIGLGFSEILAKNGINIIQVGRNPLKLQNCATDLTAKYGIQVKSIKKDFLDGPIDPIIFFSDIFEQCKDLDVSILVNNVGYGKKSLFVKSPQSLILHQNALNLWPIVFLSRLFIKKIESRKVPGSIVNLSSVASNHTNVLGACYAAGKSFDKVFSVICDCESPANILCVTPGYVKTPMEQIMNYKPLEITAIQCAESSLKSLNSVNTSCGHPKHWFFFTFIIAFSNILNILSPIIIKHESLI